MTKQKIWTAAFARLFCLRFVSTMVYFILNTTFASIVYSLYSSDAWVAGMVIGAYMFGMVLGRLLLTRYTDVIGRKRIMLISAGLSIVAIAAYFAQVGIAYLIGFRVVHGIVQGLFSNVITAVGIAQIAADSNERHSEGVATYSLAVSLATAVGPFIGAAMLSNFSYQGVYGVAVAVMVVVLFGLLFMPVREVNLSAEQRNNLLKKKGLDQYLDVSALPISIMVGFTSNAGYIIITTFLATFTQEQGIGEFSSLYFAAYAGFLLLFRPASGSMMDKFGNKKVIVFSFAANVLGLMMLAFSDSVVMLVISSCLNALGQGCLFTCGQAVVTRNADPLRLPVISSTYYVIADVGYTLGPILFGLLVPLVGYSGMYIAGACMIAVACIAYLLFTWKTARN